MAGTQQTLEAMSAASIDATLHRIFPHKAVLNGRKEDEREVVNF